MSTQIDEVTLRVHEALHSGTESVSFREGGKEWPVRLDHEYGVPCVVYVSPSGTRYMWIVQDVKSCFQDDRLFARLSSAGHRITRVLVDGKIQSFGVVNGTWTTNLAEFCTSMVRKKLRH